MKNYTVDVQTAGTPLRNTTIGCWSIGADKELYLTLDSGYACFVSGQMVLHISEALDGPEVFPLPPDSKVTFIQQPALGENKPSPGRRMPMYDTTPVGPADSSHVAELFKNIL